jgi:TonB-dependent starch-binding outer membrane protein SusC
MQKKTLLLFLFLLSNLAFAFSQKNIKGTVVDKTTHDPLIGVSVLVKNSSIGTVTDIEGNFVLKITDAKSELIISYVGYETQTILVGDRSSISIELQENTVNLDQIVVIGYGVQKKSDLTGAVSSVNTKDIRNMPTTGVAQAIQGKAAGVEIVQNSGSPGANTSIRIRGAGTINNSDPLYIVDGTPMESINFLAPDDIASVEILKDAASSAIYGSRAANGVVLITTRTGSESLKPQITFNSYLGWQEAWKNPDVMTKEQYIFFQDYASNTYKRTELNSDGVLSVRDDNLDLLEGGSNWWDVITRKGLVQKYSLSASGGSKNINYYLSGNFTGTQGIVNRSDYDRFNVLGKVNANLSKSITLGLNISYSKENRNVVEEDGKYGVIKQALIYNPLVQTINSYGEYVYDTPVEKIRRAVYGSKTDIFLGQFTLNWNILPSLAFNSRASITTNNLTNSYYYRYNLSETVINDNEHEIKRELASQTNISWDNILTYTKTFNSDHNFSAMVGQTMEISDYEKIVASGYGYGGYDEGYDALDFANLGESVSGYGTGWRALGLLSRISYDYKSKYLIQTNFRSDGSSRFAKKNRWGFFPSVSVGWKISGEEFMKNFDQISMLKIRAGWGQLGNNRVGDFAYNTYVQSDGYYIYGSTNPTIKEAMSIKQIGNEDITWERTQTANIALDLNLFNNRFSSSFDFFTKDTKDMLIEIPLTYYNGFDESAIPLQNAGGVNNKGVEIQMSWKDQIHKFKYEIGGNISFIKNKVTSLGDSNEPIYGGYIDELGYTNKTMVGLPIGAFYGWKTAGIIQEDEDISNLATFKTDYSFSAGDMKFVDINGDGVIDDDDKTYLGSPHPAFYYGFNINLEYANFDLSMFFQGVYGNKIYNATRYYLYSTYDRGGISNVASDYMDVVWRGTPTDVTTDYRSNWPANPNGTVPAPNTNSTIRDFNFKNSDFYLEDGSYLRMKNIQLGYNFSSSICNKLHFTSMRLYTSVTNLLTFTKYSGLDPEIGKTLGQESNNLYLGIDEGRYPQPRTYTFGLIVNL